MEREKEERSFPFLEKNKVTMRAFVPRREWKATTGGKTLS
jgi:hypothetical protein